MFEKIKLLYRAYKYKNKNDKGGIAYIINSLKEGETALDIGAHKAGYLYFIRKKIGASGKVCAFEPQTVLYQYLKMITETFGWKNVSVYQMALSDTKGTAPLLLPENNGMPKTSPGATIAKLNNGKQFAKSEDVAVETLDNFCVEHSIAPNFLKIDVEGNELALFNGARATLAKFKPKILVEIEARHIGQAQAVATFKFLESLGYKGFFLIGLDMKPLSEFSFEAHQNIDNKYNYCNNFVFE